MSDQGFVIDRMFAALAAGEVEPALACLSDDAKVWHGFDGLAHDKAAMRAQYQGLVDAFPARDFVDVRRQPTPTGFVQQHVMTATTSTGQRKAWPACVIVRIENGLITRLDEYIDRAGTFEPPATGVLVTPGLDE